MIGSLSPFSRGGIATPRRSLAGQRPKWTLLQTSTFTYNSDIAPDVQPDLIFRVESHKFETLGNSSLYSLAILPLRYYWFAEQINVNKLFERQHPFAIGFQVTRETIIANMFTREYQLYINLLLTNLLHIFVIYENIVFINYLDVWKNKTGRQTLDLKWITQNRDVMEILRLSCAIK